MLKYPSFNKYYSYDDIFNYIDAKKKGVGVYPEYINIKIDKTKKKFKKKFQKSI